MKTRRTIDGWSDHVARAVPTAKLRTIEFIIGLHNHNSHAGRRFHTVCGLVPGTDVLLRPSPDLGRSDRHLLIDSNRCDCCFAALQTDRRRHWPILGSFRARGYAAAMPIHLRPFLRNHLSSRARRLRRHICKPKVARRHHRPERDRTPPRLLYTR